MRDNMLVNVSGLEGHAMPIDLNIEHLIGELKVVFLTILPSQFQHCVGPFTSQRPSVNVGSSWKHFSSCGHSEKTQKTSRFGNEGRIPGYHT